MTTMTRFVPLRSALSDVSILQNRLNSIFQDFARPADPNGSEALSMGHFVPAVDVYEDEKSLQLMLEVPGIPKDALDIRIEGRNLTVSGQRSFASDAKEDNFHRIERRYGNFTRTFTLPNSVDAEQVDATSVDGVLTLSFTKKPEAKPRQIEVKVGSSATSATSAKQVEGTQQQA